MTSTRNFALSRDNCGGRFGRLFVSLTCVSALGNTAPAAAAGEGSARHLEEVVVTAQKRIEKLQDVPVPVTAISADSLVQSNQLRIQDYSFKVPGLSLTLLGDVGAPTLTIRGINTGGYTNPTVGVVIDDIPFGTSTVSGGGYSAPDFDPSELSRIEVLRGPQGTLYGASSLGGLLKYVTVDPSMDRLSGRLQAGTSSVKNADDLGYSVRGSVNVPVGDTFAIRASGSTRQDPGYIDDPVLGIDGVNRTDSDGGRLAALWQPTEDFSLRLSALIQQTERRGENTVHLLPGLGELQHSDLIGSGALKTDLQAYSATLTTNLGRAKLVSLTGYSVNDVSSTLDTTPPLGEATEIFFGVTGTRQEVSLDTDKFTQEVRLSFPVGDKVEWLVGGFYASEDTLQISDNVAVDAESYEQLGSAYAISSPFEFTEKAVFTNLTFNFTDRFDIQVGGRASEVKLVVESATSSGPFNPAFFELPFTYSSPRFESQDDAYTYLFTPRFKVSQDLMMYARLASGYRPGGPNEAIIASSLDLPSEYAPDTSVNYEFGVKGSVLDAALTFDTSVYYIDWNDIQIQLRDEENFQVYYTNAGRATSKGVEASAEFRTASGFTASSWLAWNDAKLTEVPAASVLVARPGDRLPYSSRFSGNISLEQELASSRAATFVVGASVSYVDERRGRFFTDDEPRETFPSYVPIDLYASAEWDTWTINAFVNNVTDKRGVLRGGRDSSNSLPYAVTYTQPRTVGVLLTKAF